LNPTIRDVAKLANTSKSTVSRFLNGQKVKKETEEALIKAIKELNFYPNVNARRLVMSKTKTIGVVVDDIANYFYSPIISGIEKVAKEKGFHCVFYSLTTNYFYESSSLELLYEGQVDGLILVSFKLRSNETLNKIANANYPIVLVGHAGTIDGIASVDVDDVSGITDIVHYLNRLGHEKIAYISGPENYSASKFRLAGFQKVASGLGIKTSIVCSNWSNESGYNAMNELLQKMDFTAVVASNDEAAIGALRACHDLGYQIPHDFSITGYDDIAISSWVSPSLTTVRQPFEEIGRKAAEYLFQNIENENDSVMNRILLKPKLIVRDSCVKVG